MAIYTIETTYHLPVYRQRRYEADTLNEACRSAVAEDDWDDAKRDYESSGETYVTGIWEGADAAYAGSAIAIPEQFGETIQRKAELFDVLVDLLREPARVMGLSRDQFAEWLPRALDTLAKADAIVGGPLMPES